MVEYAVLLAYNASDAVSLFPGEVVSWASRLDGTKVGIAAVALISLRMGVWAFKGR